MYSSHEKFSEEEADVVPLSSVLGPGKFRDLWHPSSITKTQLSYHMRKQIAMSSDGEASIIGPNPAKLAAMNVNKIRSMALIWAEQVNLKILRRECINDALRRTLSKWGTAKSPSIPAWLTDEVAAELLIMLIGYIIQVEP
jgi:hypothetical protein